MIVVSKDSVNRHVGAGHVPGGVPSSPLSRAASDSAEDQLKALRDILDGMMSGPLSPNTKLAIIAEHRRTVESIARVVGPVAPDDGRPTWVQLRELETTLFDALEPFPEARRALSAVLRSKMSDRSTT